MSRTNSSSASGIARSTRAPGAVHATAGRIATDAAPRQRTAAADDERTGPRPSAANAGEDERHEGASAGPTDSGRRRDGRAGAELGDGPAAPAGPANVRRTAANGSQHRAEHDAIGHAIIGRRPIDPPHPDQPVAFEQRARRRRTAHRPGRRSTARTSGSASPGAPASAAESRSARAPTAAPARRVTPRPRRSTGAEPQRGGGAVEAARRRPAERGRDGDHEQASARWRCRVASDRCRRPVDTASATGRPRSRRGGASAVAASVGVVGAESTQRVPAASCPGTDPAGEVVAPSRDPARGGSPVATEPGDRHHRIGRVGPVAGRGRGGMDRRCVRPDAAGHPRRGPAAPRRPATTATSVSTPAPPLSADRPHRAVRCAMTSRATRTAGAVARRRTQVHDHVDRGDRRPVVPASRATWTMTSIERRSW